MSELALLPSPLGRLAFPVTALENGGVQDGGGSAMQEPVEGAGRRMVRSC